MANEITVVRNALITSGNFRDGIISATVTYDLGAIEKSEGIIGATTAEADLTFTGVTTPKFCVLKNLDSTNIIQWGPKSGGVMVEVGRIQTLSEVWFEIGSSVTIRYRTVASTASLWWRVWG